jgi:hypothetical protein
MRSSTSCAWFASTETHRWPAVKKRNNSWDIEEQIRQENPERARRENESERQRGKMQQAQAIAYNKRMRENSRELEIMLAEAAL